MSGQDERCLGSGWVKGNDRRVSRCFSVLLSPCLPHVSFSPLVLPSASRLLSFFSPSILFFFCFLNVSCFASVLSLIIHFHSFLVLFATLLSISSLILRPFLSFSLSYIPPSSFIPLFLSIPFSFPLPLLLTSLFFFGVFYPFSLFYLFLILFFLSHSFLFLTRSFLLCQSLTIYHRQGC